MPNIDPCLQVLLELRVGLHIVDKELIEGALLVAGSFCPGEQLGEHGARPVDLCQHSVAALTAVPKLYTLQSWEISETSLCDHPW